MLFNSYPFLLGFLPVVLAGFFLLGRLHRSWACIWLLVASLAFYGWWSPRHLVLLLASIAINFAFGRAISGALQRGAGARAAHLLAAGVTVDLALLAWFKYANFLVGTAGLLTSRHLPVLDLVLPLGISFFTFTQIAYLVDARRGLVSECNPVHYALFVTYFPHLIAGPILHHKEMMPQFSRAGASMARAENFAVGTTIFAIGLCKKVLIADRLSPFVAPTFDAVPAAGPTFFVAWGAALAYTFQLYFDFSGYSDMAIGVSRLFGIRLPLNFASPYKSLNIVDFWRRWHITLSRFLRDYLYIAFGGNRRGPARRHVNLLATMILGGLWHGAGWTFVAWGALHGVYLVLNHAWRSVRARSGLPAGTPATRLIAWSATFIAVVAAWVLFRSPTFGGAVLILEGMAGLRGVALPAIVGTALPGLGSWLDAHGVRLTLESGSEFVAMYGGIGVASFVAFFLPNTQQIMTRYRPALGSCRLPVTSFQWRPTVTFGAIAGALAAAGFMSLHRVSEFLYYQF
jgi:D-alanyl-lipoteichoic acid acyltransferase DltB (MBOAT superfamily)